MRKIFSTLAVGAVLLISAAASEAAEKHYIPVLMEFHFGDTALYWMKLNSNGTIAKGPVLVRESPTRITTAAIVPEGNKILYAEEQPGGWSQIYSVGVNPKNGAVVNGPTQLTTGSTDYEYDVRSITKDGRKFSYDRYDGGSTRFDVFLKKFKPNGSVGPSTITIAATGVHESESIITEDGRGVYYRSYTDGTWYDITFQKLKARGRPSGTPITAVTYPGELVGSPRVDATRGWMSYVRESDIWVTRLSATGTATGTPVKVTSVAAGYHAHGGLTRDARLLVYTVRLGGGHPVYTLYSQRLDASGNPAGAPVVLIPTSTNPVFPWDAS